MHKLRVVQKICLVLTVMVSVVGCDVAEQILPGSVSRKDAEGDRKRSEERQLQEQKAQAAAEFEILSAKGKALITAAEQSMKRTHQLIAADITNAVALSRAIDAVTAKSTIGKSPRYEALIALLENQEINELARSYLGMEFNLIKLEMIDEYENAESRMRAKEEEMKHNKEMEKLAASQMIQDLPAPKDGKNVAVKKLEMQISDAEREYEKAKRDLETTSGADSARELRVSKNRHLMIVEGQLKRLRSQYDALKVAKSANMEAERIRRSQSAERDQIERRRADADFRVERRYRDLLDPVEILTRYERKTITALRVRIDESKIRNQHKADQLTAEIAYFKSIAESSNISDVQVIRRLMIEVDERIKKGFDFD